MITKAIQDEVYSNRMYQFVSPLESDVGREDMPHCNNCGDVAYRTYFCVGHFVLCQCCQDEADAINHAQIHGYDLPTKPN
jgi:hypothetical protein